MRFAIALVLMVLLGGCGKTLDNRKASRTERDESTAIANATNEQVALKILDYDSILRLVESHRGKVVVMDAWSTSCPPCMRDFHNLVELQKQYPDKLSAISLSLDFDGIGKPEEQQERVLKFLRKQGATFDNVLSSEESDTIYKKFKLSAVPAVFVYGPDGKLVKRFDLDNTPDEEGGFYPHVKKLVAELINGSGKS